MAAAQGDEILQVQGSVGPSVAAASAEIRAQARELNTALIELERQRAAEETRLISSVSDVERARHQANVASLAAATEQTRTLLRQQIAAYNELNRTIASRPGQGGTPAPPPPTPPAPPGPGGAGGLGPAVGAFFARLAPATLAVAAIYETVRLVRGVLAEGLSTLAGWAEQGVAVNTQFELMRAGLQAEVAANYEVRDAQGRELEGLEKINALRGTGLDLQEKIVGAAYSSGVAIKDFASAFQLALSFGAHANLDLDETVEIVRRLALVAKSLNIPFDLAKQQIAQILRGGITVRTTLAQGIGLTPTEDRAALQQGNIYDVLIQKTQGYADAQGTLAQTLAFVAAQADVLRQKVLAAATESGFKEIVQFGRDLLDSLVRLDEHGKLEIVDPALKQLVADVDQAFKSFVQAAVANLPLVVLGVKAVAEATSLLVQTLISASGWATVLVSGMRALAEWRPSAAYKDLAAAVPVLKADQKAVDDLRKATEDANKALDDLVANLSHPAPHRPPPPEQGPVSLTPREQPIDPVLAAARAVADAKERAAAIERESLAVQTRLADVEAGRSRLSMEDLAARAGSLAVEKARNEVAEKQALLDGARAAYDANDRDTSRGRVADAERAVTLAREHLATVQATAARSVELARVDAGRVVSYQEITRLGGLLADLEVRRGQYEGVSFATKKGELELAVANQRVVEATLAVEAAGTGTSNQGRVSAERNLAEAVERRRVLEEQVALAIQNAANAQARLNAAVEESRVAVAGREAQAAIEDHILAVQREELVAIGDYTPRGQANLSIAQANLALLDAQLAKSAAENRLAADRVRLSLAQYDVLAAIAASGGNAGADAVRQAELAERQAEVQAAKDAYAVDAASVSVNRQNLLTFNAITDALARQVEEMGGLRSIFSDIQDIGGLFAGGLSKALRQAMSQFAALGKAQSDFVKTASQDLNTNFTSVGDALKGVFSSFSNFTKLFTQQGGKGIIDLVGAVVAPIAAGIQDILQGGSLGGLAGGASIGSVFGQLAKSGAFGQVMKSFGGATGELIGAGIGLALGTHNPILGALGGALAGGLTGAKIGALIGGPIGAGIGAAIGAGIGAITGVFTASAKKKTDKIVKDITSQINATVNAATAGTSTISASIQALQNQEAQAIAQLSGRKGASQQLTQITQGIDQAIAQLKAQQKQVFDQFQAQLRVLEAGPDLSGPAQAIETLNNNVKQFLDAGGSALDAQRYVALSLQSIYRDAQTSLTDAQKNTIDLLQQSVDLAAQRQKILKDANDQENQIRQSTGLVRVQSQAQTAGQQIAAIEAQKKAQLDANQAQQDQVQAQIGALGQIFGLTNDVAALEKARLAIMRLQSSEVAAQVLALQQFLQLNQAAFSAANSVPTAPNVSVPGITGSTLTQGGPVLNFAPGSIIITAGPGTDPQSLFKQFTDGVRLGLGTSPWRLSTVR